MGIILTIIMFVVLLKIIGLILKICGKIIGGLLGLIGYLFVGIFAVTVLGLAAVTIPIILIVGAVAIGGMVAAAA